MPTVIVNNPVGSGVIYGGQYHSVWVKPYHGMDWQFVPYLTAETDILATAPSDSEATLTWNYGKYVNLWGDPGGTLVPLNVENWHVAILVHTRYGTFVSWDGVVVGETLVEKGIDVATGLPKGDQTLECRGPEYLLERRVVLGTYVGDATDYVYLPRGRNFNDTASRRESLAGNRSAAVNETSGTYLFSSDGNKWSNFNIIKYLLAAFQPWYAYQTPGGGVGYRPEFYLVGQTEGLKYIFEEHRLSGRTLREALNTLIDRKRGFGWYIHSDGIGPYYIVVFSLSQYPLYGTSLYVPANPRQIDVPLHDDKWIEARYRISSTSQVDQIVVEGTTPIMTCASVHFGDGSLEPAWDAGLDAEFGLSDLDTAYHALAQHLYANWDTVHQLTYYPFIQFADFLSYSNQVPAPFAFLLTGGGSPVDALLAGFNVLDGDGDGALSKEDLLLFPTADTYQAVTDEERATDAYGAVFSHFQVPRNWPWPGWTPRVYWDGTVDITETGAYWTHDTPFERYLPFMEPGSAIGSEREYMEPFGVIERPSRIRDVLNALAAAYTTPYNLAGAQSVVTDLTESEFDEIANGFGTISEVELQAAFLANPARYVQLDRTQQLELPACSLRMGDSGMRIIVKSEVNHIFALNHEAGGSFERPPLFDYRTLLATVFFQTDMMPRVHLRVWTNVSRDEDGNLVYQSSPIGKTIYIQVPGKEVWIAAPWTVTGLDGTDLVFFQDGAPGILRDDTPDLRSIAVLAHVWYGQQRASIDLLIKNQFWWFNRGDLIRSTVSGSSWERVGTCVTAISRNYQAGTQEVSTGYGELDPAAFGSKFL